MQQQPAAVEDCRLLVFCAKCYSLSGPPVSLSPRLVRLRMTTNASLLQPLARF